MYVGMVYLPVWLVFSTLTDSLNPLHALIGRWFCTVGWMFSKFTYNMVLWNSLILAAMRYVLIVHSKAYQYKREMLRRLFIFLSVFIPVVLTIWTALEGSDISVFSFINKCNGVHHKIFLHKTLSLAVQKSIFGNIETTETQHNLGEFVNVMKDILRRTRYVLTATIGFNIVEGILYYKILHHMNRTHKESMTRLRKLLDGSAKARRHRRNILNIQITIFAWLVEFFGFFFGFILVMIIGYRNSMVTFVVQTYALLFYFTILPCVYIIRDPEMKSTIIESSWYEAYLRKFHWQFEEDIESNSDEEGPSSSELQNTEYNKAKLRNKVAPEQACRM